MSSMEPRIASELEQMLPLPDGRRADWSDVLRRAGVAGPGHVWHRGLALTGRRCRPKRFLESGFHFEFPELRGALDDLYR